MIHECGCVLPITRAPRIWRTLVCGRAGLTLDTEYYTFLIIRVHFMAFKVSAHVLVPLVTMCLQVRPAFSTTAYIFLDTEVFTKALLGTQ